MKITIDAEPKEIAALVDALQERHINEHVKRIEQLEEIAAAMGFDFAAAEAAQSKS